MADATYQMHLAALAAYHAYLDAPEGARAELRAAWLAADERYTAAFAADMATKGATL